MEDIGTRIDGVGKSDYVQSQGVKSIVENDNVVNILEKGDTENIVLLTQDEWREYIQTKYAAEQFLGFSYERRIGLKIKGKGLLYIANTVFKLKLKNVVVKYNNFKKLAEAIYGENTIKIIENKKNKILEEKQKKLQVEWRNLIQDKYTVAQFFGLKEQVSGLKIKGKGLKYIAHTVFQLGKKYFNFNFNRLAITIYGEEMEVLIQQKSDEKNKILEEKQKKLQVEWRKFIQEEFTVAQFLGFDSEKRKEKIKRRGLYYIANTVFKLGGINPVFINKDFKILAKAIYGENNELINKSIEEEQTQSMSEEDKIKEEENQRKLQEKWRQIINEQYTKKQLLGIKRGVREKLKINGKGLCYIANTVFQLGFRNPSIYKQESIILIDVIFDKEVELTKNNFESYGYDTSTVGKVQEKVGNLLQEGLLLPNDDMLHIELLEGLLSSNFDKNMKVQIGRYVNIKIEELNNSSFNKTSNEVYNLLHNGKLLPSDKRLNLEFLYGLLNDKFDSPVILYISEYVIRKKKEYKSKEFIQERIRDIKNLYG